MSLYRHAADQDPRTTRGPSDSALHILVVDDEPTVRAVVSDYLRLDGARVTEADNGHKTLEILAKDRPDLVVLDVMLPEVDGLEVLRSIRSNMDLPVILLTARTPESDHVTGLDLGADDYVLKRFSPRELSARSFTGQRPEPAATS